ncbi:MAG: sugar phosphate isomerase/epimerase, partial [Pseudomonadota bacterium]
WGMELRSPHESERTLEQCFQMAAEAGFDGMCLDPAVDEIDELSKLAPLYKEYGLGCMINAFPYADAEMAPLLDFAVALEACQVNVISGVMPLRPEEAVPSVQRWMREARERDMPLLFETHRDSLLNDLYYTLLLMDLVPDMRLCADLSHFVVDREMRLPLSDRDATHMQRVLERSDCFQGRVANREQVQIQLNFPQHQEWAEQFKAWWRDGLQSWRQRHAGDASLVFLCELGPPPYAITDRDQRELSDRWQEALQIRQWVLEIWRQLED